MSPSLAATLFSPCCNRVGRRCNLSLADCFATGPEPTVVRVHGTKRDFEAEGFVPKDHLDIGVPSPVLNQ